MSSCVVRIRLQRIGLKHSPYFRIAVANKKAKRDGKFIEIVGEYNPKSDDNGFKKCKLNIDRIKFWLSVGAQPSDTVNRILANSNIIPPISSQSKVKKYPLPIESIDYSKKWSEMINNGWTPTYMIRSIDLHRNIKPFRLITEHDKQNHPYFSSTYQLEGGISQYHDIPIDLETLAPTTSPKNNIKDNNWNKEKLMKPSQYSSSKSVSIIKKMLMDEFISKKSSGSEIVK